MRYWGTGCHTGLGLSICFWDIDLVDFGLRQDMFEYDTTHHLLVKLVSSIVTIDIGRLWG